MKQIVSTCDLYEACFYYTNICVLEKVEVFQVGKKMFCELSFQGEEIYQLRDTYLRGNAEVNLTTLKTAYSKLLQETYHAKKHFYNKLKSSRDQGSLLDHATREDK